MGRKEGRERKKEKEEGKHRRFSDETFLFYKARGKLAAESAAVAKLIRGGTYAKCFATVLGGAAKGPRGRKCQPTDKKANKEKKKKEEGRKRKNSFSLAEWKKKKEEGQGSKNKAHPASRERKKRARKVVARSLVATSKRWSARKKKAGAA